MSEQWSPALAHSTRCWNIAELLDALGMTGRELSTQEWGARTRIATEDSLTVQHLARLIRRAR